MSRIFHRIRQRMVKEDRLSRYFLYAIGEIVLVVIGILIALQVNQWNAERKDRGHERLLLEQIRDDLRLDTLDLRYNLELHQQVLEQEEVLLALLLQESTTEPDYAMAFGVDAVLMTHRSAFQSLQHYDVGLLRNDQLKRRISRHFDFFYEAMQLLENATPAYDLYSRKAPYFEKHFRVAGGTNTPVTRTEDTPAEEYMDVTMERRSLEPVDLEGMRADQGFQVLLSECIIQRNVFIAFYQEVLDRVAALDREITAALE